MTHPLRRVIDHGAVPAGIRGRYVERDLLECGHLLGAASDRIGARFPASRRCYKCSFGRPPEYDVEAYERSNTFRLLPATGEVGS